MPLQAGAAIRVEAWLEAEGRWWQMPYAFCSHADAEIWLSTFEAKNPGRRARIAMKS